MIFSIDEPERRDRIALTEAGTQRSWTYGKLSEEVEVLCDFLAARPGLVFHFCDNDLCSVAWLLACLETGTPVALLSGQLKENLRCRLLSVYRPDWIIAQGVADRREPAGNPDLNLYRSSEQEGVWQCSEISEVPVHPQLALLLSTSGSTGSPKMVRLTRENVVANASSIRQALRIEADHFPVAHLPLHYSYGLSVLNSHLLAGTRILLSSAGLMTAEFWEAVRQNGVNSFSGVPYTYEMLRRLDLEKLNVPSLLTFTQAGGKLEPKQVSYFHEQVSRRGGSFWVMYGQTEATARMTILPPEELPRKLGSAGKAIPGGRLAIKTESGKISGQGGGVAGELVYDGPNVMMGYAQDRLDLTKGDELNGRLETGDRASLDEDGFVYILGRAKRDAKLFGLRVNLDELEGLVKKNGPAAAVSGGDRVVIFCAFGDDQQLHDARSELASMLRINSSAFELRRIDQLPTNASGKIDYEQLRKQI